MVVIVGNGMVIDYPSMARCEAAKAAFQRQVDQMIAAIRPVETPGGGTLYDIPPKFRLFCIPG